MGPLEEMASAKNSMTTGWADSNAVSGAGSREVICKLSASKKHISWR